MPDTPSTAQPEASRGSKATLQILAAVIAVLVVLGVGAGIALSRQNAAIKKTNAAITAAQVQAAADQKAAQAKASAAAAKTAADAAAAKAQRQAAAVAKAQQDATEAKALASRVQAPKVVVMRPQYRPTSVTDLGSGLFCRDLKSMGYSYSEAVQYWYWYGQPANMDADLNGTPCETVY